MRDTIYSIDTVYIQNKLDSISQLDMGQHINTIHSTYDSNMIVIYWVLGIAFAVFGILIPWFLNKNIDKTETRIQEDSNRNEIRLNREIEHIRNENRRFQDSIDTRIEERINRRVEDFDLIMVKKIEEFDKKYMKTLDNMNSHIFCHLNITQAILFYDKAQYKDSINIYLRAVFNAINVTNEEYINIIKFNIENNSRLYSTVQKSEINPEDELTLEMYFKKLESNIGNNESFRTVYNNFKKTLLAILKD